MLKKNKVVNYSIFTLTLAQGCRSCSILPSRMGEHGVSLENMGNMETMENMEKMENINQMTQKSPEDL